MKTLFFTMALLFCSLVVSAQTLTDKDVPAVVMTAFKGKFTAAIEVKWKKNKNGKYIAEFKTGGKKTEAKFEAAGQWVSSEQKMAIGDAPADVSTYVKQNYAAYTVKKVELVEKAEKNNKVYKVKLEKGTEKIGLVFDATGKFLKKKEKNEGDE